MKIRAEFFKAEDGSNEQNLREFQRYLDTPIELVNAHELEIKLKRKVIYSPGAWGTLKTYDKLIKDARERGFRKILTLEDDVIFARNFEYLFNKLVSVVPGNWRLLFLGASQHSWKEGGDYFLPSHQQELQSSIGYYFPFNTDGAFAVGIHESVFDVLLEEIDRMNSPFDSGALRKVTHNYIGDCYVAYPNLIIADVRDSDNLLSRKMSGFAKTVRWDLSRFDLGGND
jgi:GR25 family glycosyltransferase involved in LPS biosynthesis